MEKRERHVPMRTTSDYLLRQSSSPLSPTIRERLDEEMRIMQAQMDEFKLGGRTKEASGKSKANLGSRSSEFERVAEEGEQEEKIQRSENIYNLKTETSVSNNSNKKKPQDNPTETTSATMSADRESTPLSSAGSTIGDPLAALSGSNRATTTERRTTTTTTTKRTVKSSDDFIPTATDIQQVRSESRTGSISSSTPIYSAGGTTTTLTSSSGSGNLPQQQQSSSSTSSSTHTTTTSSNKQQGRSSSTAAANADGLQSPLIQDTEEGRVLKLRFDVTQYEPDEIVVKTVDNRLTVHAKHEERSENRSVYREYNREFHLPDGTDVEQIRSSLSKDGVLTVDCPLPSPQLHGASRRIPIEKV